MTELSDWKRLELPGLLEQERRQARREALKKAAQIHIDIAAQPLDFDAIVCGDAKPTKNDWMTLGYSMAVMRYQAKLRSLMEKTE